MFARPTKHMVTAWVSIKTKFYLIPLSQQDNSHCSYVPLQFYMLLAFHDLNYNREHFINLTWSYTSHVYLLYYQLYNMLYLYWSWAGELKESFSSGIPVAGIAGLCPSAQLQCIAWQFTNLVLTVGTEDSYTQKLINCIGFREQEHGLETLNPLSH